MGCLITDCIICKNTVHQLECESGEPYTTDRCFICYNYFCDLHLMLEAGDMHAIIDLKKEGDPEGGANKEQLKQFAHLRFYCHKCTGNHSHKCANCYKESETELLRCGKCRRVFYCSKECQLKDWKLHKKMCKEPVNK